MSDKWEVKAIGWDGETVDVAFVNQGLAEKAFNYLCTRGYHGVAMGLGHIEFVDEITYDEVTYD
jgi:hypothetical protein